MFRHLFIHSITLYLLRHSTKANWQSPCQFGDIRYENTLWCSNSTWDRSRNKVIWTYLNYFQIDLPAPFDLIEHFLWYDKTMYQMSYNILITGNKTFINLFNPKFGCWLTSILLCIIGVNALIVIIWYGMLFKIMTCSFIATFFIFVLS